MQAVILCGGKGTRLREETDFIPKPLIKIGEKPILWHIMKIYASYGINDFLLCLGYKGNLIREYFYNYDLDNSDVILELGSKTITKLDDGHEEEGWRICLADTGQETLTGGRLKRIERYLDNQRFVLTYGDGVADIDLDKLRRFHAKHGKLATVTAVRPSSRFGELAIDNNRVTTFQEKPQVHEGWINGGFFVFEKEAIDLIGGDADTLEQGLLSILADRDELAVYLHDGFWQCMDTYREMELLNEMWRTDSAPWVTNW